MFGIYKLGEKLVEFQENNMGTKIFLRMTRVTAPKAKEFSILVFVSKMSLWSGSREKFVTRIFWEARYDLYLSRYLSGDFCERK